MKRIGSNCQGAVMVMAVFVAILLVGLLYHVSGVGGAVLEHQLLQDGADAAAFSAATVHARGMNILALLNLIMVAILTILVALKLVQAILVVLLVVVSTACAIPPFSGCAFIAPLEVAQAEVGEVADAYQEVAKGLIKGLTKAGEAVNEIVPFIALAEGFYISRSQPYNRITTAGVVWPIADGLPTKKGSYSELCARAGQNITVPVELILPPGVGDFVAATLGELLATLAESFSAYFCGDDGGGNSAAMPESSTQHEEVTYPPGQYNGGDSEMWGCNGIHPTEGVGTCHTDRCKNCAERGCDYCLSRMRNDSYYKFGLWTVVRNDYVTWWGGSEWIRVRARGTTNDRWSLETHRGNPCRSDDNPDPQIYNTRGCVSYSGEWQWRPNPGDGSAVPAINEYAPRPICETQVTQPVTSQSDRAHYLGQVPAGTNGGDSNVEMIRVAQTLFVALSSCTIVEEIEIQAEGESMTSGEDEDGSMAPRVLDPDRFPADAEIRSILLGTGKASHRKRGVAIGFGDENSGGEDRRFSFASAEYYSMDTDDEAMWHMRWLSRLVRFQLDLGGGGDDFEAHGDNNAKGAEWTEQATGIVPTDMAQGIGVNDFLLH